MIRVMNVHHELDAIKRVIENTPDVIVHAAVTGRESCCGRPLRAFSDDLVIDLDAFEQLAHESYTLCGECKSIVG